MSDDRRQLLSKLKDASPLDDPTAFVLLATYLRSVGLTEIENSLIARGIDPKRLEPMPRRTDHTDYDADAMRHLLMARFGSSEFDEIALRSLQGVDRRLAANRGTFEAQPIEGLDGRTRIGCVL